MKLFVITEVLYDYSSGMVAIKAKDMAEARKFFIEWLSDCYNEEMEDYKNRYIREFDISVKAGYYRSFELSDEDQSESGMVIQVWGGG